jgi:hypothetical protein
LSSIEEDLQNVTKQVPLISAILLLFRRLCGGLVGALLERSIIKLTQLSLAGALADHDNKNSSRFLIFLLSLSV